MRELERDLPSDTPAQARPGPPRRRDHARTPIRTLAIVGRGRLGNAIAQALRSTVRSSGGSDGLKVTGPLGRGSDGAGAEAVLLCVPDSQIPAAAANLRKGALVGHCSGATGLDVLRGHEAFSVHPLMSVTGPDVAFAGAGAAIAGSSPRALQAARQIAHELGLRPIEITDENRAAYHAAASIASNYLIALQGAAEQLAVSAGVDREQLVPLVRATVENWARLGPQRALTGPVARGDEVTVERQRSAVAERTPQLLELFDALTAATRELAHAGSERSGQPMRTIRTIAELRKVLSAERSTGRTVGLVPTMGALHEGHLSLIRRARAECEVVVASLFVNPTQFNDPKDLDRYPRDEERDASLARESGVDYLFAPSAEELYPSGFSTTVSVAGITETLEGAARGRGHFDGVATVVTKLLNIVAPDVAFFGQKDAQQALVIERLARDLDMPVRIEVSPTVRESDGLAMSSRNILLSDGDRERAGAIPRALRAAELAIARGVRDPAEVMSRAQQELDRAEIEPEYLELVDPRTLAPVQQVGGEVLAVLAACVGRTRLIDNQLLSPAHPAARQSTNGRS